MYTVVKDCSGGRRDEGLEARCYRVVGQFVRGAGLCRSGAERKIRGTNVITLRASDTISVSAESNTRWTRMEMIVMRDRNTVIVTLSFVTCAWRAVSAKKGRAM